MNSETLKSDFFVSCAPYLLCIIACLQIYLAITQSLSPWKGGGFGMFSTVDSPNARFLRIYLITENEEIPILIPESLRFMYREVRTIPTYTRLSNIANHLAQGTWVPYRFTPAVQYYQNLITDDQAPTSGYAGTSQQDCPDCPNPETLREVSYSVHDKAQIKFEKIYLLRMIEKDEPKPALSEAVKFLSIRAELWRYKFDAESSQLKAAKFIEITVNARTK